MVRQRTTKDAPATSGRGSKEAIEKRRAARQLNALLTDGAPPGSRLDGRTEKRRKRLILELKQGRRGVPLKPIDFLTHVNELLELGESVSSLKKAGVKSRKAEDSTAIAQAARQVQDAYQFKPDVWKLIGLDPGASPKNGARKAPTRRKKKKV